MSGASQRLVSVAHVISVTGVIGVVNFASHTRSELAFYIATVAERKWTAPSCVH